MCGGVGSYGVHCTKVRFCLSPEDCSDGLTHSQLPYATSLATYVLPKFIIITGTNLNSSSILLLLVSVQNVYLTGSSVSCFITNSSCYFLTFYTRHFWWLAVLVRNSLFFFLVLLCDLTCSVYSQSYWCVKYNEPSNHEILI